MSGMGASSGMAESIEAAGMEVSSGREQLLKWLRSGGSFWLLGHVASSCEGQILTTTDAPRSSACRSLRKRSERAELMGDSSVP